MKKTITVAMMLAFVVPAQANEIPGTRVEGQGAVCAEGQGKALEVNIALKKEFSYCIELPKPKPTPTPTSTPTPTASAGSTTAPISQTVKEPAPVVEPTPSETSTATTEPTPVEPEPTPTPTPTLTPIAPPPTLPAVPEKSNVIIADVSAKTVTVREETETEYLNRWLSIWSNWFNELLIWFASLG